MNETATAPKLAGWI